MAGPSLLDMPPELRVRIYEYTLSAGKPLQAQSYRPTPPHGSRSKTLKVEKPFQAAALLRVNHLIHREALPVMYKVNTFSVTKAAFCAREKQVTKTVPKLKLVIHLQLSGFAITEACHNEVVDGLKPCITCKPSASALRHILGQLPQLRTLVVDYGLTVPSSQAFLKEPSQEAFRKFRASVKQQNDEFSLICKGPGHYRLEGEITKKVDITFVHADLVALWPLLVCSEKLTSSYVKDGMRSLQCVDYVLQAALGTLNVQHRHGHLPQNIASIWPSQVAVDLGEVGSVTTPGFLGAFGEAVEEYIRTKSRHVIWVRMW